MTWLKQFFDPRHRTFSLSVEGRVGPLIGKPDQAPINRNKISLLAGMLFVIALFMQAYEGLIHNEVLEQVIVVGAWSGIGMLAVLNITYWIILLIGRFPWQVRRLHDLGRSGWDVLPDLGWAALVFLPPIAFIIAMAFTPAPSGGGSWVLFGFAVGMVLWAFPIGLAFWGPHLNRWRDTVETVPGEPGHNQYGPPPEAGA